MIGQILGSSSLGTWTGLSKSHRTEIEIAQNRKRLLTRKSGAMAWISVHLSIAAIASFRRGNDVMHEHAPPAMAPLVQPAAVRFQEHRNTSRMLHVVKTDCSPPGFASV